MSEDVARQIERLESKIVASMDSKNLEKLSGKVDALSKEISVVHLIKDREERVQRDIEGLRSDLHAEGSKLQKTTDRLHTRIDEVDKHHKEVSDVVKAAETRNRTIASVLSIVWFVIGSFASWAFKTSEDKVKEYAQKVDQSEKVILELKRNFDGMSGDVAQINGLKRRLENVELQMDQIKR